jgi:hypothetical protein
MNLKNYIQQNKSAFNYNEMSSKADVNFQKLLKQELHKPKKQKVIYLKYLSVAASLALLISVGYYANSEMESNKNQQEVLANLENTSAGKRLEGIYKFNDEYEKEDEKIIATLVKVLHKDNNANVKIATVDALLKFPKNEIIRTNLVIALEKEETPLVQIKLIKALSFLRENRARKSLENIINNKQTYPIVKNNAALAMVEIKQ